MAKRQPAKRRAKPAPEHDGHGYPRPMLVRDQWTNLNGPWEFAIDTDGTLERAGDVRFDRSIRVPFSAETPASGVHETGFFHAVWYRRTIDVPRVPRDDQRVLLHFGAVDFSATVWVNDQLVATHEGGYTPFCADVTEQVRDQARATVVVRALDNPHDFTQPRGKQDWWERPHSIWYYRTTGIWQTVWLEVVPAVRIEQLRWTPDVQRCEVSLYARVNEPTKRYKLELTLKVRGRTITEDIGTVENGEARLTSGLGNTTFDNFGADLLWSPDRPNLIDAELRLLDESGKELDRVRSYTALRSIAVRRNGFELNGSPTYLRLVLDQGYWQESGLTPPSDDAIRKDVELVKALGFNGVRKHQKIEDPRFLYWADRIGLLVWEELPSAYRFSPRTVTRLTKTWTEAIERDVSHPCLIAWVPFNESWGVPNLPDSAEQRNFVRALYALTKALDGTRPVIGNDGWELVIGDFLGIHDYDRDVARLRTRYENSPVATQSLLSRERPGHRLLLLDDSPAYTDQPIVLTEFGGIAFSRDTEHTWGYQRASSSKQFQQRYTELLETIRSLPLLAGFCYTQFTDTYQEANGLLFMDRTPKFNLRAMHIATSGTEPAKILTPSPAAVTEEFAANQLPAESR